MSTVFIRSEAKDLQLQFCPLIPRSLVPCSCVYNAGCPIHRARFIARWVGGPALACTIGTCSFVPRSPRTRSPSPAYTCVPGRQPIVRCSSTIISISSAPKTAPRGMTSPIPIRRNRTRKWPRARDKSSASPPPRPLATPTVPAWASCSPSTSRRNNGDSELAGNSPLQRDIVSLSGDSPKPFYGC